MLVIISIGSVDRVEAALEQLETLLGAHIGVRNVSDIKVLSPDRF